MLQLQLTLAELSSLRSLLAGVRANEEDSFLETLFDDTDCEAARLLGEKGAEELYDLRDEGNPTPEQNVRWDELVAQLAVDGDTPSHAYVRAVAAQRLLRRVAAGPEDQDALRRMYAAD